MGTTAIGDLVDLGVADLQTGPFGTQLKAAEYQPTGVPVINVRNVGFGDIRNEKLEHVGAETAERLRQHRLHESDIVFGRKGAVERHAFLREEHEGWIQGSDCIRLRLSGGPLLPRFLSYYLSTPSHQQWMVNQCSHGATMASLNQDILRRIEVPTPPMDEQRKIAAVLAAHDELIENNLRRIEILEEMAQAVYRVWFVNFRFPGHEDVALVDSPLGPTPEGWEACKFGAIAHEIKDGVDPSTVDADVRYVGLEHIPQESFTLKEWGFAADVGSRKWRFRSGDVLFGKLRPYFHKVVETGFGGICSTDAIVIRPVDGFGDVVLQVAFSKEFVAHAIATSGGTDRPRAKWSDLADFDVVIPNDEIGQDFSSRVRPIVNLAKILARQNGNLRASRDLLLPKLVSGEIDVSDLPIDTAWPES